MSASDQWLWLRVLLGILGLFVSPKPLIADRAGAEDEVYYGNQDYFNGDYTAAEGRYTAAVAEDDTWAVPFNNRGLARFHQGNFSEAEADFDAAKAIDAAYVSPYLNKGKCLAAQKHFTEAIAELEAGIGLGTTNALLRYNLGWVYDEMGEHALAITNYNAALGINTNYYRAMAARGVSYGKQGMVSNAVSDLYATINGVASGDMLAAVAAYDVQLLRGPGVDFETAAGATNFIEGIFQFSAGQYDEAIAKLRAAQTNESAVADIPWITMWANLKLRRTSLANAALEQAQSLMNPVVVRSKNTSQTVYADGVRRGTTPATVFLFSSEYDLALRSQVGTQRWEWVGRTYTDGSPGGTNFMRLNPVTATNFLAFGPVADTDRDWLADAWETRWFGDLSKTPGDDETDHDSVLNLDEHWASSDPTRADTDGDGISDNDELFNYHSDPAVSNVFYYVNNNSTNADRWCTAVGNDGNSGQSPATPKASLQALLSAYALAPASVVCVDAGSYALGSNVEVTGADGGSLASGLIIQGAGEATILDRGDTNVGSACIVLNATTNVTVRGVELRGGYCGLLVATSAVCRAEDLELLDNGQAGLVAVGYSTGLVVRGALATGSAQGVSLVSFGTTDPAILRQCTLAANSDAGLSCSNSAVDIRDSILTASGTGARCVRFNTSTLSGSFDYNCYYPTNGAGVARLASIDYMAMTNWLAVSTQEVHSVNLDPLFVGSGDYHLQSTGGSFHGGAWTNDAATSPCIDVASPSAPFDLEPEPNGSRANMGRYGGTAQASKTGTGRFVQLLSPNGSEQISGTQPIRWIAPGTWGESDTLTIEYSSDNGASWTLVGRVDPSAGVYFWDTSTAVPNGGALFLIRITCTQDASVTDRSDGWFYLRNSGGHYYVNDNSIANDEWCTAVGNDANSGADAAHPKATVQAVLDTYDLAPGDEVRIDTGTYNLTNDIAAGSGDGGASSAPVRFVASPYGVTINRGNLGSGCGWNISAPYMSLSTTNGTRHPELPERWLRMSGAQIGIYLNAGYCRFDRCEVSSNQYGIYLESAADYSALRNCLVRDNTAYGIYFYYANVALQNCTVAGNGTYGVYLYYSSGCSLSNSIISADGAGRYCVYPTYSPSGSDFNLFHATNGAQVSPYGDGDLTGWRLATGKDAHSLSRDPLFVNPQGGDFHLKSTAGSYHSGAWMADAADSPGIDTGLGDAGSEPEPNDTPLHAAGEGARNLGAYGGTEQGSKTPAGRLVWLYEPIGGENYLDTNLDVNVRWTWTGTGWQEGDTVNLQSSANDGTSYTAIPGADAIAVTAISNLWDIAAATPGPLYRLKITANQGGVFDASSGRFRVGSTLAFYINDSSTNADEWCTAPGSDANDGVGPASPKASVQSVLADYDLAPGDEVRIDTGAYNLTNDIAVGITDGGASNAPVRFVASPYGVDINRGNLGSGCGWNISAPYMSLSTTNGTRHSELPERWMRVSGAQFGIYLNGGYCQLDHCEVSSNQYGIYLENAADYSALRNCLVRDNRSVGIYHYYADVALQNCTVASNGTYGVYLYYSSGCSLSNSIISADGAGRYCVYPTYSPSGSDFNLFHATNGARVSTYGDGDLTGWRLATGKDAHSLSRDPLFVDSRNGDFHLKSTAGSYHAGAWTADGSDSPGIDTGFGDAGSEPATNATPLHAAGEGARNLGAYGGTEQGSKTPAGRLLWLYEPIGGESYLDTNMDVNVRWTWTGTGWQEGDTVNLQSSENDGTSYTAIPGADAIAVTAISNLWDIAAATPGPLYRLKITANQGGVFDASSGHFRVGPAGMTYYINDASTNADEWCTAPGSDANDGVGPATPKVSVQSVLADYDLAPGDEVRIDTGIYNLTNDITVTSTDGGSSNAPVRFVASPYGVDINRGNLGSGYGWSIAAPYISLSTTNGSHNPGLPERWMKVSGAQFGIYLNGGYCQLDHCEVSSNQYGIYLENAADYSALRNCLVRDNRSVGIYHYYADVALQNCTVASNGTYGVYLYYSSGCSLSNSIISADGAGRYCVYPTYSPSGSDFNLFHATNGARVSTYGDGDLTGWRLATGKDAHSLSRDPLFVNPQGGDFHLKSTAGSYHGGAWTADAADSPGIDTGCGDAGVEPAPNATPLHAAGGGARNLGAYGGTEQGSKTPAGRLLWLYQPIGGENYLDTNLDVNVRWTWTGTGWQDTDTINLQSSANDGAVYAAIPGADAIAVTAISNLWDIGEVAPGPLYRLKITANLGGVSDASSGHFRIGPGGVVFYVNDASTNADEWCTAPGSDTNDGVGPATPKVSVQSVLADYDLAPGDEVRIDTGIYNLTNDITVTSTDGGSSNAPVRFVASPYGVDINRGNMSSSYAWLISAPYVSLSTTNGIRHPGLPDRWMKVSGAYYGIYLNGGYCQLDRSEASSNRCGIYLGDPADYSSVGNCLARNNSIIGIELDYSSYVPIQNCTVASNGSYGVYFYSSSGCTLSNSILSADGAGRYCLYQNSASYPAGSDFNLFHATNGARVSLYGDGDLTGWRATSGKDVHSLSRDPLFVDPLNGDFHLKSTAGSYHAGAWTTDAADSPGIDTGAGGAGLEPAPNATPLHAADEGARNLGAYGGTEQASKTTSGRLLWFYLPIGGESYLDTNLDVIVRWTWVGTGWQDGNTVNLQSSADDGASYSGIPGAGTIGVTAVTNLWDIGDVIPGPLYRLKITANEGGIFDASPGRFRVGSSLAFYVNDAGTNADEWCSAPGTDANDGVTPASPKASVQSVLAAYDLAPNDAVYIDTGTYNLSNDIAVGAADGGSSNAPVRFVASPYGVDINRGNMNSYGWNVSAPYVSLCTTNGIRYPGLPERWMKVSGAQYGIYLNAGYGQLDRCEASSNQYGIVLDNPSDYSTLKNCLGRDNRSAGIYLSYARVALQNCTVASNGNYGVYIYNSSGCSLSNSIITADGPARYGIYRSSTSYSLYSDYNLLFATNGAIAGYSGGNRTNLVDWQSATGQDSDSVSDDPLFVNRTAGDFHVQSTAGSYHGGAWTADAADSPAIDMGDPSISVGSETSPNGFILNLGAYGGTTQASRSPDADGDDLGNNFETVRLGTNPGLFDTDGDGWSDGAELVAGTNPLDRLSHFGLASFAIVGDDAVIRFPTSAERDYLVEFSTDLRAWSPLPNGTMVGTGGIVEVRDPNARLHPCRFYRLRVLW